MRKTRKKIGDRLKERMKNLYGIKETEYKTIKHIETLGGTRYHMFVVDNEEHRMSSRGGFISTIYWGGRKQSQGNFETFS